MKIKNAQAYGENLLLRLVDSEQSSEFISTDGQLGTPIYEVIYNVTELACSHVIIKPGHYPEVEIDGVIYTVATLDDVLAEIEVEND